MKTEQSSKRPRRTLLFVDTASVEFQRTFINRLCVALNDLLSDYHALGIQAEFQISDIDKLRYHTAQNFIKSKVLPTIKKPDIGGQSIPPEGVFDLMQLDVSAFGEKLEAVKNIIKDFQQNAVWYNKKYLFDSSFFTIDEGEIIQNVTGFDQWIEDNCKIYVANDKQELVYGAIKEIANALNSLKTIGNEQLTPIYQLKKHPQSFFSQGLQRMIKCDEKGNYEVNHEFIINH
jgi:hypothetical protein